MVGVVRLLGVVRMIRGSGGRGGGVAGAMEVVGWDQYERVIRAMIDKAAKLKKANSEGGCR